MKSGSEILLLNTSEVALGEPPAFVECRELPPVDARDLESVRRTFQNAAVVTLRQDWRDAEELNFTPGEVRVGWRASSLLVLAELIDHDVFSRSTAHNQHTWLLGDTFEIFLRPTQETAYVEFHVTPNNHHLQLRYQNSEAVTRAKRNGCLKTALVDGEAFRSIVWVQNEAQRWFVYAEIPATSVCRAAKIPEAQPWRFSFGRYDYERGDNCPVLSSSSPHRKPDFHRQEEWGTLVFTSARSV